MDSLSLSAEALAAVTGILRTKPLTEDDAGKARELPRLFSEKVKAFLADEDWRPFKLPKYPDYEKTYDTLIVGSHPDANAKLMANVQDQQLADAYGAQVDRCREYLLERWPMNQLDAATGPLNLPPSTMQQGQAWALYSVVNDPRRILDEMLMGTLLGEKQVPGGPPSMGQAEAFRELCPGLFGMLRSLLNAEIRDRVAKDAKYTVPWLRERVMRVLLGLPTEVPIVEAKRGAGEAQPEAPPVPEIDIDFSRERPRVVERAA